VIALFSPGLKLAELVTTPETGKSFAWTFGWFLRIAILATPLITSRSSLFSLTW